MDSNNNGISEYIQQALKQGESSESIKESLVQSGYHRHDIDEVFKGMDKKNDGEQSHEHPASGIEGAKKVLIVEDDKFLREIIVKKMIKVGFEVKNARNSKETMDILDDWSPDIILLDLILPGEGGFSILEKIKKEVRLASIPVVILSNLGQEGDKQKATDLGAIDFMVKSSFTLEEIIERVSALLHVTV